MPSTEITVEANPIDVTVAAPGPPGDQGDKGDKGDKGDEGQAGFVAWEPSDNGALIACSMSDPASAVGVTGALGAYPLIARVKVPPGTASITKAGVWIAVAGSGLTAGQNYLGVYNTAGDLLAKSPDQTAQFQTPGLVIPTLDAPITPDPDGEMLYVVILINGTTAPLLAAGAGASGNSNPANIGISAAPYRCAWYPVPQTTLPATIPWAGTAPSLSIFLFALA